MNIHDAKSRLKEVRSQARLSQEEFAKRVGVSRGHIANVEAGADLSDPLIKKICREFAILEPWLKTGEGPMRKPIEELIKGELSKYGERAYLEVLLTLAKSKQYDESFARFFERSDRVSESASYGTQVGNERYQRMADMLSRIIHHGDERTISAIEFMLSQSVPKTEKG